MAQIINDPNGGINGGQYKADWMGIPTVTCPDGTKDIPNGFVAPCIGKYKAIPIGQDNRIKVLCNDGTYDFQAQEPSTGMVGKVAMPCRDKGGIAKNQPTPPTTQGNATKEPIFYILVTAGVLVAGYFAYKKFKK